MSGSRFGQTGRAIMRSLTGLVAVFGLSLFGVVEVAAQNTGTVTGLVRDVVSLQTLAGAQVTIDGTPIGGLTNNIGRYLLLNVPAGEQTVTVLSLGFGTTSQTVTVEAGQTVTVDFGLRQQALALEGVVVTGTAGQARRREIGNQVSQVSGADIELAAITSVSDILHGRSTGVQIQDMTGQVGGGAQIRIRGNSSLTAGNDPLIYIDGMRMEASAIHVDDEAGASPMAMDFINPNDIERIEIIKGPAATTLYGTEAAGGVIQIFTKRGSVGAPAWTLSVDQGVRTMPLLAGFGGMNDVDINPTGYYMNDCSVHRAYNSSFNPLFPNQPGGTFVTIDSAQAGCPESGSWFHDGHMQRYNLSVRGGGETATYFVSGRWDEEEGNIAQQGAGTYGIRANVSFQPLQGLDISMTNSYQRKNITWIPDGNNASGFMLNVVRGEAGYTPRNDDSKVFENDIISNISQYQTTAGISYSPSISWAHRLNVGLDYTVQDFVDWKYWDYYASPEGYRENDHDQDRNLTADYSGSFSYGLFEGLSSVLSFGGQVYEMFNYGLFSDDQRFAGPGEPLIGDGTNQSTGESRLRVRSGGFFLQEQLAWRDRLFVVAGVRYDGFSTFGDGFGLARYPKLSASYILSDESFFPQGLFDQFKLRVAWGQSGKAPGVFAAEKLWAATSSDEQQPAVVLDNFGNSELGPERSTELEWGVELSAFEGRVYAEFTKYDQVTKDALIGVQPAASTGTNNSVLRNLGEVKNWGTETALTVVPVRLDNLEWSLTGQYSTNDSEITDLGPLVDLGSSRTLGWPLWIRYDDRLITCDTNDIRGADANTPIPDPCWDPNGMYDPNNEPDLGKRFLGRLYPTEMLSINSRMTLWQTLTLDVLGEGQYGFVKNPGYAFQTMRRNQMDNPVWPYCAQYLDVWNSGDRRTLTNAQVVECVPKHSDHGVWLTKGGKGDFFKIRSATLAWRLPQSWLPAATQSIQIMLQGKNLLTFSDYIGMDPESADNGPSDQTPYDYYITAPPRIFMLGVTVNF